LERADRVKLEAWRTGEGEESDGPSATSLRSKRKKAFTHNWGAHKGDHDGGRGEKKPRKEEEGEMRLKERKGRVSEVWMSKTRSSSETRSFRSYLPTSISKT